VTDSVLDLHPDGATSVESTVDWNTLTSTDVERELNTHRTIGLSDPEVLLRQRRFGPNALTETNGITWLRILGRQFVDALIWILIAAAGISVAIGELPDAITILAIVGLNGILGFLQEWKAERAIEALRQMLAPECRVLRSSQVQTIAAEDLVPGDIVQLEAGDRIPADLRLLEESNLRVDESSLTGESDPVSKSAEPAGANATTPTVVWMGTTITNGRALGAVIATGTRTQFGRIAQLTSEISGDRTPLQRKLGRLGRQLAVWAIGISVLVILAGIIRGKPVVEMMMTGISLAVAIVPEGLPAVVTITLALGIRTMVRRKALLRRLQAAEALGSATVICTDKTGTLTQNQMTVQRIWLPGGDVIDVTGTGYDPTGHFELQGQVVNYHHRTDLVALLQTGLICNHANIECHQEVWHESGEPTEAALIVAACKAWLKPQSGEHALTEFSFSSERKRMTIVCGDDNKRTAHVKGAPEVLLDRCSTVGVGASARQLNQQYRLEIMAACNAMADQGLRTLGIARRSVPPDVALEEGSIEQELTLLGIVGIIDPPRPEVPSAIERAQSAGIQLVMITGDASRTATAIARRIGLAADCAVEGCQLTSMTDDDLRDAIADGAVFARTTPEHKLRIVRLLQSDGHVVGMTGDGVNDAPALKKADIGIAMGQRGTDVAKGAADIVLTDDNFSSIINAVEEGRRQYDNIQKFVRYMLSSNTGEAVAIFSNIMIGGPLILLPVQILWMNLITDGLTALALGLERAEQDVMDRPPHPPAAPVLDASAITMISALGCWVGLTTLLLFQLFLSYDANTMSYDVESTAVARTMAFSGIIAIEWFNVMNFRTLRTPVLKVGLFGNRWMLLAIGTTVLLQLCAIYIPFLQDALKTTPLGWHHWAIILMAGLPVFAIAEAVKWWQSSRTARANTHH